MTPIIWSVLYAVGDCYRDSIALPKTETEIGKIMKGFKDIAGLPYCVGSIDRSHVNWTACPSDQYLY